MELIERMAPCDAQMYMRHRVRATQPLRGDDDDRCDRRCPNGLLGLTSLFGFEAVVVEPVGADFDVSKPVVVVLDGGVESELG